MPGITNEFGFIKKKDKEKEKYSRNINNILAYSIWGPSNMLYNRVRNSKGLTSTNLVGVKLYFSTLSRWYDTLTDIT